MDLCYQMAKTDGIRMSRHGLNGMYIFYHPKCSNCGDECNIATYESGRKYLCLRCREAEKFLHKEDRSKKTVDNALRKIRSFRFDKSVFCEYMECANIIRSKIEAGMKFDSKEEVMLAMQLEKDGITYETQVSVASHKVDFMLRELRIIVEIDGELYHTDEAKDRDIDIRVTEELGSDWEIIRITDSWVDYYMTAIGKAILKIYDICESEDILFDKKTVLGIILNEYYGPLYRY